MATPSPPQPAAPKRGTIALVLGLALLVVGIAWAANAPSEHSDGGDIGAYKAANDHAEAVYGGGFVAVVGGVLVLVGLARRGKASSTSTLA